MKFYTITGWSEEYCVKYLYSMVFKSVGIVFYAKKDVNLKKSAGERGIRFRGVF